jgi:dienelactone hydrolase
MVGASFGGRIVIEAAAQHPEGLQAIVSVSGEVEENAYHDILGDARAVTTPALYVGARNDTFTDGTRQQEILHRAMHGSPNEILQVPGGANGVGLLDPRSSGGGLALGRVVDFVSRQLPSAHG